MTDDRLLGVGRRAEVFADGDTALKLYGPLEGPEDAFAEAGRLAIVAALGLPVPQVLEAGRFRGRWGLRMTLAEGQPLAEALAAPGADVPALLAGMAGLQARIHAQSGVGLPSLRARLRRKIEGATPLNAALRSRLIERLDGLPPEADRVCHGDFHPWNVIGTTVIDWLDATVGDPAADVCRSVLLLRLTAPSLSETYLEAYLQVQLGLARAEVLAWLPLVAAARLSEAVATETADLIAIAGR
jgi:aminoglycoside phosphotransferase